MNLFRNWWYLSTRMTGPETALEPAIAALGERYRSQWLFMGLKTSSRAYIADFVLLDRKLIIEVDGASHNEPKQAMKDRENAIALHDLGWTIVRLTNEEVAADPKAALTRALSHPSCSREQLVAALEQHLRIHPWLLEPKPRKPRRSSPPRTSAEPKGRDKPPTPRRAPASRRSKAGGPA